LQALFVRLFEQDVIPAARKNVAAAKASYEGAKLPSFMAIAAERETGP
jgi:cytochrome c1